ncbi:MAG: exodeoxyribonuclease VII large subunit [Tannerella sp.]|jgi:exodeoxyribonuclease VII large subunit|nr:exodeoxyribonuclease VII large subunit [Tannerella sp.]
MNLLSESFAAEALTLSQLNEQVSDALAAAFPQACWIQAETSDVRLNAASGHCYLEFVEKDALTGQIAAKARGVVWARVFRMLRPFFEESTGQAFASGLKVLVKVTVEFHKLYGYCLNVIDIEPTFTLGDLVRKRQEIIARLQEEGIFDLNRELPLPLLPQRIAVISSSTAAGYGDFENQLLHNRAGYSFYLKLFPALMQGEKAEASIIAALDKICTHADNFDLVAVIRGGGAASELHCFDSYALAAHCAQFPLPVITGIGHERDDTIVDMVAHTRLKTPTAVAAFLTGRMDEQTAWLNSLQQTICTFSARILVTHRAFLNQFAVQFPPQIMYRIEHSRIQLHAQWNALASIRLLLIQRRQELDEIQQYFQNQWSECFSDQIRKMELSEQFLKMASPDYVLQRGYALILKKGQKVRHASALASGDEIVTRFADGDRTAVVR